MKNHEIVDGKLLQTNKKFSQLKMNQREWIANRFRELYHEKMKELNINEKMNPKHRDAVLEKLYKEIKERDIWIPFGEVKQYCSGNVTKTVNIFRKKQEVGSIQEK